MNVMAINKKAFKELDVGVRILCTLVLCADANGEINLNKSVIANYLKVSRQTVGKHIKSFAEANMLKFKFSGRGWLNPEFLYNGPPEEKNVALNGYQNFKSDV